jgi:hypothetical protein
VAATGPGRRRWGGRWWRRPRAVRWARRRGASGLSLASNVIRREAHGYLRAFSGLSGSNLSTCSARRWRTRRRAEAGPLRGTKLSCCFTFRSEVTLTAFEPRPPPSTSGGVVEPGGVGGRRLAPVQLPRPPGLPPPQLPCRARHLRGGPAALAGVGRGRRRSGDRDGTAWWPGLRHQERLFLYTLPAASFRLAEAGAAVLCVSDRR